MNIILSHSGKQHSYQVAKALFDLKHLNLFYTSSYITSNALQKYFVKSGNTYFTRRFIEGLPGSFVKANWHFELKEIIYRKIFGKTHKTQNAIYERDVKFDQYVRNQLYKKFKNSNQKPSIFWGFQGSCYKSLTAAKDIGIYTFCELATAHIAYANKILGEESKLNPKWADSIDILKFPVDYENRLLNEPFIADSVIVASEFTKMTLEDAGVPDNKIIKLPLGFDMNNIKYDFKLDDKISNRPLKLLYAGTVTQRKGISYLLAANEKFKKSDIELHIIGGIQGDGEEFKKHLNNVFYHKPVSQQELFNLYCEYDALVLPTIFDGFGLVILEALSAGLPVITTNHSFGSEIIIDNYNGYLVPIRDVDSLYKSILMLRNKSDDTYTNMRENAHRSSIEFNWLNYQKRLEVILNNISVS